MQEFVIENNSFSLLETINTPSDLKKLNISELKILANEIRNYLLETLSITGGHLASNLGCIELTIALHYVYDTPNDLLVWDVGHQTYTHKILTERRHLMPTLRQYKGMAGFTKRDESIYDVFGAGHSSTSVSAALGMAVANKINNKDTKIVSIIGDGAMTAGLAFEGLNNVGWLNANMLVILNDNEMSISENVGAISRYLSKLLASNFYNTIKETASKALEFIPPIRRMAHKMEEHVKGMIMPGTLFEELGFNYIGPIDGHDLHTLIDTLEHLKNLGGAQFLHIVTKKGQGYKLAENNPITYHGVTKFDLKIGLSSASNNILTYTQVFSTWIMDLAKREKDFVAITPAMREGSGLVEFAKEYPDKYFDVGIAEQHAITFAAGLSTQGIIPIVAIYSTFLQRGYDQLIHDVALQNLPVVFAIDRAGIVGADGPTHIGAFDLSFLRAIPNMIIMAPSNENECFQMLNTAYKAKAPVAVRYPRGVGIGISIDYNSPLLEIGKGECLKMGEKVVIFAFGVMTNVALEVAKDLNISVCNMKFVKPLDAELIIHMSLKHEFLVTIEENVLMGGAGSAIGELLSKLNIAKPILHLGIGDEFLPHGDPKILLKLASLDKDSVLNKIKTFASI